MSRGRRQQRPGSTGSLQGGTSGGIPDSGMTTPRQDPETVAFEEIDDSAAAGAVPGSGVTVSTAAGEDASGPERTRDSTMIERDQTSVGGSGEPPAESTPVVVERRGGGGGFLPGLLGGIVGAALVGAGAGYYAYEYGPVKPALERLASTEATAQSAQAAAGELKGQVATLGTDLTGLRGNLDETRPVVASLGEKLTGLEQSTGQQIQGLTQATSQQIEAIKQTLGEQVGGLQRSLGERAAAAEQTVAQAVARMDTLANRVTQVEQAQPADIVDKKTVADVQAAQGSVQESQRKFEADLARMGQIVGQGLESGNQQAQALRLVLDQTRTRLDEVASQQRELLALQDRLSATEKADQDNRAAIEKANQDSQAAVEATRTQIAGVQQALDQRLQQVVGQVQEFTAAREKGVGLAIATHNLDEAMQSGAPYADTLGLVRQLGENDQAVTEIAEQLQPSADHGVATLAALARQLDEIEQGLTPVEATPPEDWAARTRANLQGLINLHGAGEEPVPGADAVKAARQALLDQDLPGAVAAMEPLANGDNAGAATWLAAARARLDVMAAIDRLRDHARTVLAQQG